MPSLIKRYTHWLHAPWPAGEPGYYYSAACCLIVLIFALRRIRRRATPYETWQR